MTKSFWLVLILSGISTTCWSQEKDSDLNNLTDEKAKEQPLMVVTSDDDALPKPLASESTQVYKTSGGANLINPQNWQQQKATNIKDLLDLAPGVFVQQRNGAESARVSIRGSGLGRQFQGGGLILAYDGIPLNTADGSFDFQAIDPWLTDYITAYRGANGMLQGGSTLGGVINLGTTEPNTADANELRLAAGSFATNQGMFSITSSLNDESSQVMRLRYSHFNQNGFRVQNQQRSNRLDLQHVYQNDQTTAHKTSFYHLNTYAELPSSLSKALINDDPRQSRAFNIRGNFHRDLTLSRVAYQMRHQTQQNAKIDLALFYAAKRLTNPVFTYIDRDSDDFGMKFRWSQGFNAVHFTSQQGNQDELRRENESGLPGAERLFRDQQAQTSTLTYQRQQPVFNEQLTGTVAIQGVYAQRDITESRPARIVSNRSYQQINPRIGLLYQATNNIQWFSNLSRSFEAPTFAELNNGNQPGINAPIKAQSADTLELGSRGTVGSLQWDAAIYYSQLDNEFIRFRFPDGATKTTNADQSIHLGFESALKWQLADSLVTDSDQLNLNASYQWNQFELDNDPTYGNNKIPGIPEHYLQSQLTYQHPSGWTFSPSIEWVPTAYYIDLANSYRTDNYLLTGLNISYQSPTGFEFYLDAKNLNDQTYISTSLPIPDAGGTDGNYFYSGEGRAVYAGVKWVF